jgi:leukotriene-A4 hydrolase
VDRFTQNNEGHLTALRPTLTSTYVHPDDAFSSVPYEKGSAFLFYLETLLGGPGKSVPCTIAHADLSIIHVVTLGSLDEFLRAYVKKFKFSTVTTLEWKDFFLEFFDKEVHLLNAQN